MNHRSLFQINQEEEQHKNEEGGTPRQDEQEQDRHPHIEVKEVERGEHSESFTKFF